MKPQSHNTTHALMMPASIETRTSVFRFRIRNMSEEKLSIGQYTQLCIFLNFYNLEEEGKFSLFVCMYVC